MSNKSATCSDMCQPSRVSIAVYHKIQVTARRGERVPTPHGITPCLIAIEGGIIFSEFERRFFNLRYLHRLAGTDQVFEE
ncbi:hypothetical protein [Sinorhizobium meliloti]|uniref:hypothetical protein n=1 Tax=Rhizobium meliloti TaxID=382 RepID=UPI0020905A14|nr:hypothetical protein [Sinorhizobium meliloti]MCO5966719.1 hypothetical protein [Sinorhizobium meliloti]